MFPDAIIEGQGVGSIGSHHLMGLLLNTGMDEGVLRPWIGKGGGTYVTLRDGRDDKGKQKHKNFRLLGNTATLSKEEWVQYDEILVREARPILRVVGDIESSGLIYNIPDGMATTVLQHQTMTDYGDAVLSMDGLKRSRRDRPHYALYAMPLPIVSSDWGFPLRELASSRKGNLPLDTNSIEQGTRKCAELTERLFIGTYDSSGYTYNADLAPNSTSLPIYGLTTHPSRITATMTLPTAAGWVPETFINEILSMLAALQAIFFNGSYTIYYSPNWTKFMGGDYSAAYSGDTLKTRLVKIDDISSILKVDFLTGYQIIIVQKSNSVIQSVNGMPLRNIQWASGDGLEVMGKIMGIKVPRIRTNANGNTGIAHGTAA